MTKARDLLAVLSYGGAYPMATEATGLGAVLVGRSVFPHGPR
jgi:hypothetical protein